MMSWWAFACLLVSVIGGAALLVLDKFDYFPVASFVLSGIAVIGYFVGTYNYIFNYIVGIDVKSLSAAFVICAILVVVTMVASIVILCMEQRNEEK